ncbi:MAG: AAA family ATPase [Rhodospirillaceae bacterium]
MYLAELHVKNFRKLRQTTICFQPGLNILVGANNIGKTAVVDGMRALLAGHDEPYPRLRSDDQHRPKSGAPSGPILWSGSLQNLGQLRMSSRKLSLREVGPTDW